MKQGYIGNIKQGDFEHIWYTRERPDVAKCPPCWMDAKNEIAEYMMTDAPPHVNFV